jgi:uncharacterized protein
MRGLGHFSLPIKSLKGEQSKIDYAIDRTFFDKFENAPIAKCNFTLTISLIKVNDTIDIIITGSGRYDTVCDRCTADIKLPIDFEETYFVKITDEPGDDIELIYLSEKEDMLDLAPIVFEAIVLNMPIINTYDCEDDEPLPCDEETLNRLEELDEEDDSESPWDALGGLDLN